MRDVLSAAIWLFVIAVLLIVVGVPVGVFGLLHVKEKGWLMKVKRLLGGLFVAVLIAFVLSSQPVQAFYMECLDGFWWVCWP